MQFYSVESNLKGGLLKMNNKKYALTTLIALSNLAALSAFAQTTTSATLPATETNASTSTTDLSKQSDGAAAMKVSYLGIMSGVGLEMSGSHQASNNTNDPMSIENRVGLNYNLNENMSLGFQPRFKAIFAPDNIHVDNGNYRLSANFKNVYKNDIVTLSLTPRLDLPTSKSAHQSAMLPSPELIATMDIAPKDSRFSGQIGNAYMQGFYGNNASGKDYANALTAMEQPWAEVDYQISPKFQAFAAYWPEFDANARTSQPLHATSNEVDFGTYIEVAKGWQIAPYIATEAQGIDQARLDKNMQFNLYVIGTVL